MDQIIKHKVNLACSEFISSISCDEVCNLASSFHSGAPCRIYAEPCKGSFNICFPVVFGAEDSSSEEEEVWIVRFPLLPRMAFVEEKMRSEMATMKYLAERTSIPVPHIYGYGFGGDYPTGLPFILMEYINGTSLFTVDIESLDQAAKVYLYTQIADISVQLRHQEFSHIGSLTLDSSESWTLSSNRPLTIDINEHEIGGLGANSIIPPHRTFSSTIDYLHSLRQLVLNQFTRQRDSIYSKEDGQLELYGLYEFSDLLIGWARLEYNHGPFVLKHGDFRSSNIIVNQDMKIVGVIDWEWSCVVPLQLFVPPAWLTGLEVTGLVGSDYQPKLSMLNEIVKIREAEQFPSCHTSSLSSFWSTMDPHSFFIGHALSRLNTFGDIYWKFIDDYYQVGSVKERISNFYDIPAMKDCAATLDRKLNELEAYEKELQSLNLEVLQPRENEGALPPDLAQRLAALKESMDKWSYPLQNDNAAGKPAEGGSYWWRSYCLSSNLAPTSWAVAGIFTLSLVLIAVHQQRVTNTFS